MPPDCVECGHPEDKHDCCPIRCLACTVEDGAFHQYDPGDDWVDPNREGDPAFNGAFDRW
jgi:hypothetical protein